MAILQRVLTTNEHVLLLNEQVRNMFSWERVETLRLSEKTDCDSVMRTILENANHYQK